MAVLAPVSWANDADFDPPKAFLSTASCCIQLEEGLGYGQQCVSAGTAARELACRHASGRW